MSHHLYSVYAQNVHLQYERKCVDALAISTFNNCVTQSDPLVADASFQFVDIHDLGTIDLLLINVVSQWFSDLACGTQYEFIAVNVQTTTSAFYNVV